MSTPTTIRVWESHLAVYKRIWHGHVLLALVQPTLYLLGIGLGVGALVDDNVDSAAALGRNGRLGRGVAGAMIGSGASPWRPYIASIRSACSVLVGNPVLGPPR